MSGGTGEATHGVAREGVIGTAGGWVQEIRMKG